MNRTNLLLVIIFLSAAFFCAATGVASAITLSDKYVGNTVVDLEWSGYGSTDFSKYELYRDDDLIHTESSHNNTFYRDEGLSKGNGYNYVIKVYNASGGLVATSTKKAVTTGEVHGTITQSTTWTLATSPYGLTGTVIVDEGATLTIQPGVTVNSGPCRIFIKTNTPLDTVTFNGGGIVLSDVDGFSIKNCVFDGATGPHSDNIGIALYKCDLSFIDSTVVKNYGSHGIYLSGDNNTLTGNTASNNGNYGIYYLSGDNNALTDNIASNNGGDGIGLSGDNNALTGNTASNNSVFGIYLSGDNNTLTNNTASNNDMGIRLYGGNNTLTGNTASNNGNDGIYTYYGDNNMLTGNTASNNGNDGIYLPGDNNTLTGNIASNNGGDGIYMSGDNNALTGNIVNFNSEYGIRLYSPSNNNTLTGNIASNNGYDGIRLSGGYNVSADNNTLTGNTASNNGRGGIDLSGDNNALTGNTASNNSDSGIGLSGDNCMLTGNTASNNGYDGIDLSGDNNALTNNIASNNGGDGICLPGDNNTLTDNIASNNGYDGIRLSGGYSVSADNNALTGNTASNNSHSGIDLSGNNNTLTGNTASNNGGDGIYLAGDNNALTGNTANSNNGDYGIYLSGDNNALIDNIVNLNKKYGIRLYSPSNNNTLWGNDVSNNKYGINLYASSNCLLTDNIASNNTQSGIILGWSSNNTLTGNIANSNDGSGIMLIYSISNNTLSHNIANSNGLDGIAMSGDNNNYNRLTDNTVSNNRYGIGLKGDYNTLRGNTVSNSRCDGIYLGSSSNNNLRDNTVTGNNWCGVDLVDSSNNNLRGNTVTGNNRYGIDLRGGSQGNIVGGDEDGTGNQISGNTGNGVMIEGEGTERNMILCNRIETNGFGLRIQDKASYNEVANNTIVRDLTNDSSWSIYLGSTAESNELKENTVGNKYPTKITAYYTYDESSYKLRGVEDPPESPKPPEYPITRQSISKYVEIQNLTADTTLFLDFHYEDKDVEDVSEKTLKVWKHNGTAWDEGRCADAWNGTRKLDTANNIVGVRILEFCIFAPLAGLPVHNINTGEDFDTIQEAIDDSNTVDGHTITVDPDYTVAETKENIRVDKKLTIKSTSGDTADTVIEAADPEKHVIEVVADEVAIQGFTIKGATGEGKAGVYIHSSTTNYTISQSIITDNNLGILSDIIHALVLENVKVWNNGKDGVRLLGGNLLIKGTGNEIINNGGNGTCVGCGSTISKVVIEGATEIHDNGGWGILIKFGHLDIHNGAMSSINRNGKGGIGVQGAVKLPANFVVEDNGGPGIFAAGGVEGGVVTRTLILESVKVRNNKGDGIWVVCANLVIKGTGNEISNNSGNGTYSMDNMGHGGNVTIEGATEIHDNGGCGIYTLTVGNVDIRGGAMCSINRNKAAGIYCRSTGSVKLSANFVVDDNDGPGIFAIGDTVILENIKVRNNNIVGIVAGYPDTVRDSTDSRNNNYTGIVAGGGTDGTIILESVKVRNNKGDGILVGNANLVIKGTGNEISNNSGNGTRVLSSGNVTIEGTTEIHDNGGWGIYTGGGNVDIHNDAMSSINRNGAGGIRTNGAKLANFVVDDNGGPGIVADGGVEGTIILESVKVRNNKGDGISVADAKLVIKGTGNEITNNSGTGTFARDGNITIEGTTEIHDNGGWGIYTNYGNVDIHNDAMSSINKNGKGGIRTRGGVKLPANFVVDDNGGHGIRGGGGVEGGVLTRTLILESVKVRNNNGDGIYVFDANLVFKGTGNEITNNAGYGTSVLSSGNVTIEGTTEIHDNGGWGIYTEGGNVDIRDGTMSSINRNGAGGIETNGAKLANFVVDDNGGPGIIAGGGIEGTIILESVKVRNNKGDGIYVRDGNVVIKGTGNEITNNGGNGTCVLDGESYDGNVVIEGTTEIHDNGGWGIYTNYGNVDIHNDAMSSINKNGKGGIRTRGGVKLPANFVVDDNGGHGIRGGGGIVDGVVTDTLIIESVKVRNNNGDGICVDVANLVIKGTGNEISNNGGNGTSVLSSGNVTIEGTTEIHDNGGWGIYTEGGNVDIRDGAMSSINRNGAGGIWTNGAMLANFVVDDNGGPGIVAAGGIEGTIILESAKVRNNKGNGIYVWDGNVVIKGTGNEITNNGGNGTCVLDGETYDGNVVIEGTTEIHDNGGWGIYTNYGNVDIHNDAMSSINKNGKGGIRTRGGVKLPANFVVDDNGGHGIRGGGGIVDGVVTDTLILESVKVRNNNGDGICVDVANLVIKGTGNEISNNGGNGTSVLSSGNVTIEGTTEIHDNGGWGIYTEGGNVDIRDGAMSSISRNGEGGIWTNGAKLANFVVDDNGGPGIVAGGGIVGTIIIESVKVRNNRGDGICVDVANLVIKGTGNEITNNVGNGTSVLSSGNVIIEGTTEIHDNGGWGIYTEGGNVDIRDGAISSINRNGEGGIWTNGAKLANFVVDDNGGPGIVAGGGIVGTIIIESVKVRNNNGDGICVDDANLVIKGTGNEITNNVGNGTSVLSSGDVTIEGTTEIRDNGGWGIWTELGKVDIRNGAMSSVNKNGQGGIYGGDGVRLPPNFVVDVNGGPGIVCGGNDPLLLENIKVRSNTDHGIHTVGVGGNVDIQGTDNEIINNGGNGIYAQFGGHVTIQGTGTEIHDNGGWGIWTELGKVDICNGAMSSVNKNGQGGIYGGDGVRLPPNFVVDVNGGPGIVCGGDDPLLLENIKVRSNTDHGIHTVGVPGHVDIQGTDNEIINNGGNGIYAQFGGHVTIQGTGTEIHDNGGWGIWTELGKVDICNGAMSSVNKNGQGGIYGGDGVRLPPNFVVDVNGGPGIVCGGDDPLLLENIKVRSNTDHGIHTVGVPGHVDIQGTDNEIINNGGNGIYAQFGGHVTIQGTGTEIHDNGGWGIHVEKGKVNIRDAEITNNAKGGIQLISSSHGTITGNTVSNNGEYGIFLSISNDSTIYNNIFNNPKNAYDDGNNNWSIAKTAGTNIVGGPYLGGNYWSDYAGNDTDGDGLGDTDLPYNCFGDITNIIGADWHPLVPVSVLPVLSIEKSVKYKGESDSEYRKAIEDATICNNVTFKIVIENKGGSIELTNVEVTDVLNCSLGYINGSAIPDTIYANNCPNNQTLNWTFSGLEPHEYINITFDARIVECGNDTNYAHVVAENEAGYTVVDNDTAWVNCTPPVSLETATGTGIASFWTDSGTIEDLVAVDESTLPEEGKPPLVFPHGFFSFNITGLTGGQTVLVTILFPDSLPVGTQYWKYHAAEGGWIRIPMDSDDGDNVITITLVDGGLGDDDGTANGVIVDQGGPGISGAPPVITFFAPPSPVNDTVCNWRTFNVTVNQTVNVSWYLNNTHKHTNVSTKEASYTLHAEVVGEHNVSAIASNENGTDMQTWVWNVTVAPLPVLEINKTGVPDPVSPAGTLNYTISVNNTGNATATSVTVMETYDKNVTFVTSVPAPSSGDDTWQFQTLNVSETRWINVSVNVNVSVPNGTVLHNVVNVSCAEGVTDTDTEDTTVFVAPALPPNITSFAPPSPVNDTVCNWRTFNVTVDQMVNVSWYLNNTLQHTNVSTKEASYTLHAEVVGEHNVSVIASNENGTDMQTWVWNVTVAPEPVLEINKTDNPDPVSPAEALNYTIRVNNTGNATATNVIVKETYDANVTFIAAEPAPSSGDDTWQFATLNASETRWINISVTVKASVLNGTVLHNIVNVSCAEGVTDSDTEDTTVFVAPALPPNITSFAPPSPVNDTVCNWRTFNVTVDQMVNVSWYLNNTLQHTNVSTKEASYTLHAEVVGEHNVSVIASNGNGTDMQMWVWNILQPTDLPDLVIADKWEKGKTDRYKVFFVVENIGTATAPRGHYATLYVDGEEMEHKLVPKDLKPGRSYKGIFRTRVELTGDSDTIKVCADNDNDVEESDEDNNCLENEWPCEIGKPDLEIEDKWEEWVGENRYIVHYVIHNKGTGIAPAGHHTTLIVDGEEVEQKHVPEELAQCETYTDTFDTEIACTDGSDTIMVCADNDNDVEESDEDNNCLENEWTCEVGQPDLEIEDKWEEWVGENRYIVHYVIHNKGTGIAPAGHHTTLIVDGEEVEQKHVPEELAQCETYTDTFDTEITCTDGSDTINVCADNDNDVEESDEDNNCLENEWTCEVGQPDLEIEDKWEEWVGENRYIVHYVIHNKGTGIAPAGHHTTLIVDGEEVEQKHVPEELAQCETYTDTFDTEITCTDGSDTINVCADNDNDVEESDEDNNCLENEWTCEVGKPDLVIADKYERGMPDRYNVFFVVENVGTATAPGGHYATLYVDGEEMEHKLVPRDLEPGESYKGRFRAKVKLTGDSDTIKVCADNDNDVDEADETNNCLENVWL